MDERAAALAASLDRQPIVEPTAEDARRPPSRRRLIAILILKVGAVAYSIWSVATAHQPLSFNGGFWAVLVVTWFVSARTTLRQLRATA